MQPTTVQGREEGCCLHELPLFSHDLRVLSTGPLSYQKCILSYPQLSIIIREIGYLTDSKKVVIVYYFQSKTEVVKLPHLEWCGLSLIILPTSLVFQKNRKWDLQQPPKFKQFIPCRNLVQQPHRIFCKIWVLQLNLDDQNQL